MELDKILNLIAEILNVSAEDISLSTHFYEDLGADSLDLYQIFTGMEEEFGVTLSGKNMPKVETVEDLTELISRGEKHDH